MGGRAEQISEAIALANEALTTEDFAGAIDIAAQVLAVDPSQAEAYAIKARAAIALQLFDDAAATLALVPPDQQNNHHIISAKAALDLALNPVDTSALTKLQSAIAEDPNDFAARLELAIVLNGAGERISAIDQLIYVIKKDRTWNDDGARKQLVSFFEAWGPKDEATLAGRRKLSAVLFS
jgi:putative thioredoxin